MKNMENRVQHSDQQATHSEKVATLDNQNAKEGNPQLKNMEKTVQPSDEQLTHSEKMVALGNQNAEEGYPQMKNIEKIVQPSDEQLTQSAKVAVLGNFLWRKEGYQHKSNNVIPEGGATCRLALSTPSYRIVAKGKVYNGVGDTLHNRSLPHNHVKVGIQVPFDNELNTPLPVPINEADVLTIKDAIGTYVAWPINLIVLDSMTFAHSKDKSTKSQKSRQVKEFTRPTYQKQKPSSTPVLVSADYINFDTLPPHCKLIGKYALKFLLNGGQIKIDIEKQIFNVSYQDMIGKEHIYNILRKERLGVSHFSTYIRYLYRMKLITNLMRRTFSFLCPYQIAATPHMDAKNLLQKSQYIATALIAKAEKNMLFLAA